MWYILQTRTGDEQLLKDLMDALRDADSTDYCFIPMYEEVRRSDGRSRILLRRMFPGYIFINTTEPDEVYRLVKRIPKFTRLLGAKESDGSTVFIPVGGEDREFLDSILDDGIMHVSYVEMSSGNRIKSVAGPLAGYRNHIVKLRFRYREAIVELDMFGKRRHIRFGLWSEGDPELPWIRRQIALEQPAALDKECEIDIGIHLGDKVIYPEVYGDMVFTVNSVDAVHRTIRTGIYMFGAIRNVEMYADDVIKI